MTALATFADAPLLSACSPAETQALMDDPGAFSCRDRAVALMNLPFEEISSDLVRNNLFDISTYRVTAAGSTFECIVSSDGLITGFSRV